MTEVYDVYDVLGQHANQHGEGHEVDLDQLPRLEKYLVATHWEALGRLFLYLEKRYKL